MSDTVSNNTGAGKHTPGLLWADVEDSSDCTLWIQNGDFVGNVGSDRFAPVIVAFDIDVENCKRLAACWNACDGIPTEALEAGVIDDLLKAAKLAMVEIYSMKPTLSLVNAASALDAAIAKAEGKG